MASFTPITAQCSVCDESIVVVDTPRLTSDRTPDRRGAVVFVEVNQTAVNRHAATHLTEDEAAA